MIAVLPKEGWRATSNCSGMNNEWFFDEENDSASVTTAKAVCEGCPVRESCLSFALVTDERFGVWGGTGEKERWALAAKTHGSSRLAKRGCKCSPCTDTRRIGSATINV